ncbi:MAG: protoheme IX farnesyltransferase [Gammaproteobacteria bacterium]|nr:MAG: protoheme IX farnesyltransferase [Gammaproteobacteria bacterium]
MAVTALAGYAVTPGVELSGIQLGLLALVTLGASGAAGAFNQFMEWDLDRLMPRTASRPFVTGEIPRKGWWLWLIGGLLLASVVLAGWLFNAAVAAHLFLGAFFYGVVYTLWLKRRSPLNIVIGGASGSFAVLVGASAADPSLNAASVLLAIVLFLWTPPHFWALAIAQKDEYAAAGVPMLPVVTGDAEAARIILQNTLLLVCVSLLPVFFGMGALYLIGALLGGGYFIYRSALLNRAPERTQAIRCFLASLVQLVLLMTGAILDPLLHWPVF